MCSSPRNAPFRSARCHDRGGAADPRRLPALSLAWRCWIGWRNRGAALSQATGSADLVRLRRNGLGWRVLALGPAAARRRAKTCAQGSAAAGRMSMRVLARAVLVLTLLGGPALAVQPDEILKDPALETRARALSQELRCMVCQNQSIDDSDAPLAKDLRVLVRERLTAGDTDNQVIEFLVSRYGEFVLLKPRLNLHTILLWAAPFAVLIIAALAFLFARRRAGSERTERLSAEEEARINALLDRS